MSWNQQNDGSFIYWNQQNVPSKWSKALAWHQGAFASQDWMFSFLLADQKGDASLVTNYTWVAWKRTVLFKIAIHSTSEKCKRCRHEKSTCSENSCTVAHNQMNSSAYDYQWVEVPLCHAGLHTEVKTDHIIEDILKIVLTFSLEPVKFWGYQQ